MSGVVSIGRSQCQDRTSERRSVTTTTRSGAVMTFNGKAIDSLFIFDPQTLSAALRGDPPHVDKNLVKSLKIAFSGYFSI